jgi:hypothetical protein
LKVKGRIGHRLKWTGVLAAFFILITEMAYSQEAADRFVAVMERMKTAYNSGDYAAMQKDYGKEMLDAFPLEKAAPFFQQMTVQYGKMARIQSPRLVPPNQAVFPTHFERGLFDVKIVLNLQDKIIGLWFLPPTPSVPAVEKHETDLALPFKGRWLVFWGGNTREQNYHHDVPNQRYAFDLIGVGEDDKTRSGDGSKNEDFYAFGREILAPADGIVTDVIDGVRDNLPGSMNPYSALGNAVLIQHRENEISVLAHFKMGSIRVKPGDSVKRGQLLGLCGNSGNSSEPHLHYHLQNTPVIQDGTGIKCFFDSVKVARDGKMEDKSNYSPVKGDIVEP